MFSGEQFLGGLSFLVPMTDEIWRHNFLHPLNKLDRGKLEVSMQSGVIKSEAISVILPSNSKSLQLFSMSASK